MITSRLIAFALTLLLSSVALAATTSSGAGPTDPVERPKSAATQGTGVDTDIPPSPAATDPRVQGDDPGRQGDMSAPDTQTPDNAATGVGSKTTTGGSGYEGSGARQ
ncbi:hypothetical protein [Pseudomonas sp. B21-048]|uniref:hypothetical protein n=1 Tax=Pseudomonas sp. B21-048 TaxID=2895490 RepID=UPI00215F1F2F|nr:hypothetical protein [Pseudomonas sp. B21-048]UVK97347.1 hypothetical protein LOY56_18620 [Pseudomonas sp. B21-048]